MGLSTQPGSSKEAMMLWAVKATRNNARRKIGRRSPQRLVCGKDN